MRLRRGGRRWRGEQNFRLGLPRRRGDPHQGALNGRSAPIVLLRPLVFPHQEEGCCCRRNFCFDRIVPFHNPQPLVFEQIAAGGGTRSTLSETRPTGAHTHVPTNKQTEANQCSNHNNTPSIEQEDDEEEGEGGGSTGERILGITTLASTLTHTSNKNKPNETKKKQTMLNKNRRHSTVMIRLLFFILRSQAGMRKEGSFQRNLPAIQNRILTPKTTTGPRGGGTIYSSSGERERETKQFSYRMIVGCQN